MKPPGSLVAVAFGMVVGAHGAGRLRRRGFGESQEPNIFNELEGLSNEVSQATSMWDNLEASVQPQILRLHNEADQLRNILGSVRKLRIPNVIAFCRGLGSCSSCAAEPVCGWCSTSMKCVPGTKQGPADLSFCSFPSDVYTYGACPGQDCGGYTSCETCTADATCGWQSRELQCMTGTERGPWNTTTWRGDDELRNHWVHRNSAARSSCKPRPVIELPHPPGGAK
mmetsp:Transcript_51158/g.147641  ORF Transcript_51158/g.147641 Transcript_51158/m.147641 type:complete len:226 (+) Transcript_51158:146-823(+)